MARCRRLHILYPPVDLSDTTGKGSIKISSPAGGASNNAYPALSIVREVCHGWIRATVGTVSILKLTFSQQQKKKRWGAFLWSSSVVSDCLMKIILTSRFTFNKRINKTNPPDTSWLWSGELKPEICTSTAPFSPCWSVKVGYRISCYNPLYDPMWFIKNSVYHTWFGTGNRLIGGDDVRSLQELLHPAIPRNPFRVPQHVDEWTSGSSQHFGVRMHSHTEGSMNFHPYKPENSKLIASLFESVFTASESDAEGALVGQLSRDLLETTAPDDLHVFVASNACEITGCIIVFLMAPVAVRTEHQARCIGQGLINYAINELKEKGVRILVTYGDPGYYSKVGFTPANAKTIGPPFPLSQPEGWLAQTLNGKPICTSIGKCSCVPAFDNPVYWWITPSQYPVPRNLRNRWPSKRKSWVSWTPSPSLKPKKSNLNITGICSWTSRSLKEARHNAFTFIHRPFSPDDSWIWFHSPAGYAGIGMLLWSFSDTEQFPVFNWILQSMRLRRFKKPFACFKKTKNKGDLSDEVRRVIQASIGNWAKKSLIVDFINQTNLDDIGDKTKRWWVVCSNHWAAGPYQDFCFFIPLARLFLAVFARRLWGRFSNPQNHPFQDVLSYFLNTRINALRRYVDTGADISWRSTQSIWPPTGGCVENNISFGAGIGGGCVGSSV